MIFYPAAYIAAAALFWPTHGAPAWPVGCASVPIVAEAMPANEGGFVTVYAATGRPAAGADGTCVIHVNDSIANPVEQCAIVVHEVGHLNGLGHSSDPTDIMYGGGTAPWTPPLGECRVAIRDAKRDWAARIRRWIARRP